jgi:hypothetical protein
MAAIHSSNISDGFVNINNYPVVSRLLDAIGHVVIENGQVHDVARVFQTPDSFTGCLIIELFDWIGFIQKQSSPNLSQHVWELVFEDSRVDSTGFKVAKDAWSIVLKAVENNESIESIPLKLPIALFSMPVKDIFLWFRQLGNNEPSASEQSIATVLWQIAMIVSKKKEAVCSNVVMTAGIFNGPNPVQTPTIAASQASTKIQQSTNLPLPTTTQGTRPNFIHEQYSAHMLKSAGLKRKACENGPESDSSVELERLIRLPHQQNRSKSIEPKTLPVTAFQNHSPSLHNSSRDIRVPTGAAKRQSPDLGVVSHSVSTQTLIKAPFTQIMETNKSFIDMGRPASPSPQLSGQRNPAETAARQLSILHEGAQSHSPPNSPSPANQLPSFYLQTPITPDEYNTPGFFKWYITRKPSAEIISRVCRLLLQLNAADLLVERVQNKPWALRKSVKTILGFCSRNGDFHARCGWRVVTRDELQLSAPTWTPIWDQLKGDRKKDQLQWVKKEDQQWILAAHYLEERPEFPGENNLRQEINAAKLIDGSCPVYSDYFRGLQVAGGRYKRTRW